jgi:endonuclease/exonuclease/phosphatase family metal-dependent hydrolase
MNLAKFRKMLHAGIVFACFLAGASPSWAQEYVKESVPKLFTYDELVQLNQPEELSPALAEKLQALTTTPFVNNEAYLSGARPQYLEVPGLGPTLRVALWNIERGLELDYIELFLKDPDAFLAKVKEERAKATEEKKTVRKVDLERIPEDIQILKSADVWIMNEVDWGVKRTEYREVIRELGKTLNMNWAYGVEFLEIDSKQLGLDAFDDGETPEEQKQLQEVFAVDKDRVHGMHGNAVLSRYPIRSARLVPFTVGYDWFQESKIHVLEKGKRKAGVLIGEDLLREVRRGQRTTLYVDLDVPQSPGGRVTIASTHLENRVRPKIRKQQMQELLKQVSEASNPVIIGGDLNTTGSDGTPLDVKTLLYKRYGSVDFWTTKGIQWTTGAGLLYTGSKAFLKISGIQYRADPTSANIPGASPNLERGLFTTMENYRTADGKAIDFRGISERTLDGKAGTLADSNERSSAGFTPTFAAELIWGKVKLAKFKLDWIFVASELEKPRDAQGPFLFAPHFPRTMYDLNNCPPEPISDHSPMTVDLPFQEPTDIAAAAKKEKQ